MDLEAVLPDLEVALPDLEAALVVLEVALVQDTHQEDPEDKVINYTLSTIEQDRIVALTFCFQVHLNNMDLHQEEDHQAVHQVDTHLNLHSNMELHLSHQDSLSHHQASPV